MTIERLNELYSNLLDDVDFDRLDLGLKKPNIFSILKISRNEIRHSNFLSWLLNPKESHGLGDIFLKRFLREVFSSDKFDGISQVDVEGLDFTRVDVLREWNNIDILISTTELVVCVENKVFSKDHSNQLLRYRKIIEEHFPNKTQTFVYLNPEGEESLEEVENCKSVHQKNLGFNNEEMNYFVYQKEMENNAYDPRKDEIKILFNDGSLKDITQASDNLNISALAKPVKKYYLFAPYF